MSNLDRRAVLATGALGALTLVSSSGVLANVGEDAELHELWRKYLEAFGAMSAAEAIYRPARKPYEEEFNALKTELRYDRAFGELHNALWKKHGLVPLYDAVQREHRKLLRIVKAIRKTKAKSLFGIGVKLSAWEDWNAIDVVEFAEVVDAVRRDLGTLVGVDFIAATGPILEYEEATESASGKSHIVARTIATDF